MEKYFNSKNFYSMYAVHKHTSIEDTKEKLSQIQKCVDSKAGFYDEGLLTPETVAEYDNLKNMLNSNIDSVVDVKRFNYLATLVNKFPQKYKLIQISIIKNKSLIWYRKCIDKIRVTILLDIPVTYKFIKSYKFVSQSKESITYIDNIVEKIQIDMMKNIAIKSISFSDIIFEDNIKMSHIFKDEYLKNLIKLHKIDICISLESFISLLSTFNCNNDNDRFLIPFLKTGNCVIFDQYLPWKINELCKQMFVVEKLINILSNKYFKNESHINFKDRTITSEILNKDKCNLNESDEAEKCENNSYCIFVCQNKRILLRFSDIIDTSTNSLICFGEINKLKFMVLKQFQLCDKIIQSSVSINDEEQICEFSDFKEVEVLENDDQLININSLISTLGNVLEDEEITSDFYLLDYSQENCKIYQSFGDESKLSEEDIDLRKSM